MPKTPHSEPVLNPHWITFWRRVRAAAQELDRFNAEQTAGEPHSV